MSLIKKSLCVAALCMPMVSFAGLTISNSAAIDTRITSSCGPSYDSQPSQITTLPVCSGSKVDTGCPTSRNIPWAGLGLVCTLAGYDHYVFYDDANGHKVIGKAVLEVSGLSAAVTEHVANTPYTATVAPDDGQAHTNIKVELGHA